MDTALYFFKGENYHVYASVEHDLEDVSEELSSNVLPLTFMLNVRSYLPHSLLNAKYIPVVCSCNDS